MRETGSKNRQLEGSDHQLKVFFFFVSNRIKWDHSLDRVLGRQPWTKRDTRRVFFFAESCHVTVVSYPCRQREYGVTNL